MPFVHESTYSAGLGNFRNIFTVSIALQSWFEVSVPKFRDFGILLGFRCRISG